MFIFRILKESVQSQWPLFSEHGQRGVQRESAKILKEEMDEQPGRRRITKWQTESTGFLSEAVFVALRKNRRGLGTGAA